MQKHAKMCKNVQKHAEMRKYVQKYEIIIAKYVPFRTYSD